MGKKNFMSSRKILLVGQFFVKLSETRPFLKNLVREISSLKSGQQKLCFKWNI